MNHYYPSRYPLYLVYHSPHPVSSALSGKPSYDPNRAWQDHLDRLAEIDKLYPSHEPLSWRHRSPTPIKPSTLLPRASEIAYNYAGKQNLIMFSDIFLGSLAEDLIPIFYNPMNFEVCFSNLNNVS